MGIYCLQYIYKTVCSTPLTKRAGGPIAALLQYPLIHILFSDVNLFTDRAHAPEWGPDSSVSEVSTIQMEFRELTMLTGNRKYHQVCVLPENEVHASPCFLTGANEEGYKHTG